MLLPVLAGLAGLAMMGNPPKRRKRRKNPVDSAYDVKLVPISQIFAGDTIIHDGVMKTVSPTNIKRGFMGKTLFGDSYKAGHMKVQKVTFRMLKTNPLGGRLHIAAVKRSRLRMRSFAKVHNKWRSHATPALNKRSLKALNFHARATKRRWNPVSSLYLFSFAAEGGRSRRIQWQRFGPDMETTFALAKTAAKHDYPKASGFSIVSAEGRGTDAEWAEGRREKGWQGKDKWWVNPCRKRKTRR